MDEDQILQSIIADPKLTDPSIDVGQLMEFFDYLKGLVLRLIFPLLLYLILPLCHSPLS